jgi:branched-chain amino acid transport system substrate-binding protein
MTMRSRTAASIVLLAAAAMLTGAMPAQAQNTIRIGIIHAYSGQFADGGAQIDNGLSLYMKQHGDTVAGKKIEIIRRDTGGINPPVAKRLAQELIVRDKVDILSGFALSPNAFAAADISKQADKFMVIMNAATSSILDHSPYVTRTSLTLGQPTATLGSWAAKNGVKEVYLMVTDYAPGHDAQAAFTKAFEAAGGKVIGSVRIPVANPDFSAYVQRAKDFNPQAIFIFIPGGTQPAALAKALAERGVDPNEVKILTTGEMVGEQPLEGMGERGLGIIAGWHYDVNLDNPTNKAFVKAYREEFKRSPDFFSVGGYDGMHLIYEALKKTGGKTDAKALIEAAKGMSWDSPRGPIKIDPQTADVVQTIYIMRVSKLGDDIQNVVIDKVADVHDPMRATAAKQ